MVFECHLCTYKTLQINQICNHLRNQHMLLDGSNLILKCARCPSVVRTYNGFRKHFKKCQLEDLSSSNEQSYDINNTTSNTSKLCHDSAVLSIANDTNDNEADTDTDTDTDSDNNAQLYEQDDDNFFCNDKQEIKKYMNNYVMEMYSLGLPELTITKILETTSQLIFPVLENIVSLRNVDERQYLADKLKYLFENLFIEVIDK